MHDTPSLDQLDLAALRALLALIDAELDARRAQDVAAARERIVALAAYAGLQAADFAPATQTLPTFAAQRYQSGTSPNFTWSGRGRKPAWVLAHLAQGGALDDLLIPL